MASDEQADVTARPARDALLRIIMEKGIVSHSDPVTLACGALTTTTLDCCGALSRAADILTAAEALMETMDAGSDDISNRFNAVGGMTLGADPLALGLSWLFGDTGSWFWFSVRNERKHRGTKRQLEGTRLDAQSKVLLVDDTAVSGSTLQQAHDVVVSETGAQIVAAAVLVDRGDTARQRMKDLGVEYEAVLTYEDLGIDPVVPPNRYAALLG